MKTATITFHAAENYGAFLQAYALQKYLMDELNIDNEILNYVSLKMKEHYNILKKPVTKKNIMRDIILFPFLHGLNIRKKMFKRDRERYLKTTVEFSGEEKYYELIKNFDVCIAGSDQIWNLESEDFSQFFFLPEAKKKISYAASAGNKLKNEWKEKYRRYLADFSKVCVREKNAAEFFDSLDLRAGKTRVCIDPTFLLNAAEYKRIAGNKRLIKKKYLIYYSIKNDRESMQLAEQIGKYYNLPVYAIYSRTSSISTMRYGMKLYFKAGPSEFLNLLQNAEGVLTNSFHGTALSIILNKNFFRLSKIENGMKKKDDRIDSILSITGLSDRTITNYDEFLQVANNIPKWENVKEQINEEVSSANNYLRECISPANKCQ